MKDIFIVSDLHLASGGLQEDFYADHEFARFLRAIHSQSPDSTLILNGDIVDFLQVIKLSPKMKTTWSEKIYGLGTEEEKSAWKLQQVMQAHQEVFDALADFALAGHNVQIIKGNHDVEWYWPKVRDTFYNTIAENEVKTLRKSITINPWFYHEPGRVWVEHGNQYDELNSFRYFLAPLLPSQKEKLMLSFGGFFVRYFFNKVEDIDPLADNFRPVTGYLPFMLRHHFFKGLRVSWRYLPFFLRTLPRVLKHYPEIQWKPVRQEYETELHCLAKEWNLSSYTLTILDALRKGPLLEQGKIFKSLISYEKGPVDVANARMIQPVVKAKHIVFGHTHVPKETKGYLNTGTWTERVILNKGNISIKKEFPYVKLTGSKAKLQLW